MRTLYCKVIDVNPTTGEQLCFKQIAGTSTETKPTEGIATGSCFLEVDTSLVAVYNEADTEWVGGTAPADQSDGQG